MITTINTCWKNQISEQELVEILSGNRDFSDYEGHIGMLFNSVSTDELMRFAMKHNIAWQEVADCYTKAKLLGSESKRFERWIVEMGGIL